MEEVLNSVSKAAERLREQLSPKFSTMAIIGDPPERHFGEVVWREAGLEWV